jgi:hypothetical protein
MSATKPISDTKPQTELPQSVRVILKALSTLEYGSVEITVHDGRIVQVERREKIRPSEGEKSTILSF